MTLPDMSGADFILKLRTLPGGSSLKVLLVSGVDDLKAKSQALGAQGALRKPFELSAFYKEIEKQLNP
jgi:DNA-binding response OmpR family regulator